MYVVCERSIGEAHRHAISAIVNYGHTVKGGEETLEILPLVIRVDEPCAEPRIYNKIGQSEQFMNMYVTQMMSDINKGFAYTYGERLRGGDIDQLRGVCDLIIDDVFTRRAIMHTWRLETDFGANECPCIQTIQFMIRSHKLYCTATLRSNDILLAWGANAYGLSKMMEFVCCAVNSYVPVAMGSLVTFSASGHIYYRRDADILGRVIADIDGIV